MTVGTPRVGPDQAVATSMRTEAVAVVELVAAAGVNLTVTTGPDPTPGIVPAAEIATKVPGTEAVALSCGALRGVPVTRTAGSTRVIVGVARLVRDHRGVAGRLRAPRPGRLHSRCPR